RGEQLPKPGARQILVDREEPLEFLRGDEREPDRLVGKASLQRGPAPGTTLQGVLAHNTSFHVSRTFFSWIVRYSTVSSNCSILAVLHVESNSAKMPMPILTRSPSAAALRKAECSRSSVP